MKSAKEHIKHANQLQRLSEEQLVKPMKVLGSFFSNYHLKDVRDQFKVWLRAGLSCDHGFYDEGKDRHNLIFFHEKLEELVEACFLIKEEYEAKSDEPIHNAQS